MSQGLLLHRQKQSPNATRVWGLRGAASPLSAVPTTTLESQETLNCNLLQMFGAELTRATGLTCKKDTAQQLSRAELLAAVWSQRCDMET